MGCKMPEKFDDILSNLKVPVDDPTFYQRVFTLTSRARKGLLPSDPDCCDRVCYEEYDDLSRRLDATEIQEGTAVRNVLRTRRIAILLFTDKGELKLSLLSQFIECFKKTLHSLGPDRQYATLFVRAFAKSVGNAE